MILLSLQMFKAVFHLPLHLFFENALTYGEGIFLLLHSFEAKVQHLRFVLCSLT
ncbi:hypothetical protein V6Z12_D01G041000 [Gossypium hirsutum]